MGNSTTVTMPAAFIAGLLSFLSPCVLPLVPAYLSYISGASVEELLSSADTAALKRTGLKSVFFVIGFSAIFIAMGASAASIGQLLAERATFFMKLAGVVIVIFGLHMTGIFRIKALYSERRIHTHMNNVGFAGAFLIGVMFAFGWTPCIGPVLATILGLAADSKTVAKGVILLATYSMGLGIPFLITGFATGSALNALARFKKHFRAIEVTSGVLMIAVGVLIFTNSLQGLSRFFTSLLPGG